jgi:translation initiation factor 3 subunit I
MKFPKITSAIWANLEDTIVSGHEGGELMLWDLRKNSKPNELSIRTRPHTKQIMDLQKDQQSTCFISASKDCTAKVNSLS